MSDNCIQMSKRHLGLLADKRKTAVAKPVGTTLPLGEPVNLVNAGKLVGTVTLSHAAKMLLSDFRLDIWHERHRVTHKERESWWPGEDKFAVWPIEAFEFMDPLPLPADPPGWGVKEVDLCRDCVENEHGWCVPYERVTDEDTGCDDWNGYDVSWRKADKEEEPMPYEKRERGDEWCVFKAGSSEPEGCYPSEEEADKLLTALRINVEAEESKKAEPEDEEMPGETMVCPECGVEFPGDKETCPECGVALVEKEESDDESDEEMSMDEKASKPRMIDCKACSGKFPVGTKFCPHCGDKVALPGEKARGEGQGAGGEPQGDGGADVCVCPECGKEFPHEKGTPCAEQECPDCGVSMQGKDAKAGTRVKKTMRERMKEVYQTLRDFLTWAEYEEEAPEPFFKGDGPGIALKEVDGKTWLFTWSTNAFRDREEEIFSTKALEEYVSYAEKTGKRGMFDFWHVRGTDFADKQIQTVIGRILVEAGPFRDDWKGQKMLEFFKAHPDGHPEIAPKGWGCSPEYRYLPSEKKSGIYEWVHIDRTSVLDRRKAANVWTKGSIVEVADMATKEQEKALRAAFGDDGFERIKEDAERLTKALEDLGVAHKDKEEDEVEEVEGEPEVEVKEQEQAEEEQQVEESPEIDLKALADHIVERMDVKLEPMIEQGEILEDMAKHVKALTDRINTLEGKEKIRLDAETPRFLLRLQKRASEAEETVVPEGDDLADKQPTETEKKAASGSAAGHFFGSK